MKDEVDAKVLERYELRGKKGKGAYGVVWCARRRDGGQVVALKKIFDAFHNATDAQRTYREVALLTALGAHPNVVRLLSVIPARNGLDLYLTFEYMQADLHVAIRGGALTPAHFRHIAYQVLLAVAYLHACGVVHRDLKPANILVDAQSNVKVADFGLSRAVGERGPEEGVQECMTEYIATRWYRAPEIILGCNSYSCAVDVWSVGCILAEMALRRPLFAGKSTLHQLELILARGGGDPARLTELGELPRQMLQLIAAPEPDREVWARLEQGLGAVGCDLLRLCLELDPRQRVSAAEALRHPYFAGLYAPGDVLAGEALDPQLLNGLAEASAADHRRRLFALVGRAKA